ncbi:MAG TPA: hypothetical protein VMT82_10220 [candidate division Zixibacteria bacterium]|nr:hypothetical protein [candidate division Zixibacteria bacterium]
MRKKISISFFCALALSVAVCQQSDWRAHWESKLAQWNSKDGFVLALLGKLDAKLMKNACQNIQWFEGGEVPSCYPTAWPSWALRQRAQLLREADAGVQPKGDTLTFFLSGPGAMEEPAETYLVFPNHSVHALWVSTNKFRDGVVYWLLDPSQENLDMIWLPDTTPRYFGPNATLLSSKTMGQRLRSSIFPGNVP